VQTELQDQFLSKIKGAKEIQYSTVINIHELISLSVQTELQDQFLSKIKGAKEIQYSKVKIGIHGQFIISKPS
jgi:hypothetical protein